ncbi:hypothetical protein BKA70DRAFT_1293628 [Coprinopsis sp. MPI-PUGE-AT-0042]|nr:hypothetical protein BKA70DRAFT_1293628 [Coprinopsis sp. MPI-PUGE-AT-0042]
MYSLETLKMSLFRPDLRFPEAVDYSAQPLIRPIWLPDYISANILTAIFFTAQLFACWYIVADYRRRQRRASKEKGRNWGSQTPGSIKWCCIMISITLTVLYSAAAITYWTGFGQCYASVKTLKDFTETEEQILQWFRDHPDHEGADWPCHCRRLKLTKNVLTYKDVELMFASLVEIIIMLSDGVLIYRFFMIFSDAPWAKYATAALGAAALAGPIMGIVILAKLGELGAKSDPWLAASFPTGPLRFLVWCSPFIAIALAVCVNVIVTTAIVTHIIRSKRNIAKLTGQPPAQSMYSGVVATLVESAFPAAFFGVTAALIPVVGHANNKMVLDAIYFTPKTLWIAFTAPLKSAEVPLVFGSHHTTTENTQFSAGTTVECAEEGIEKPASARLSRPLLALQHSLFNSK